MDFLQRISPDKFTSLKPSCDKFKIGVQDDCPIFEGIFDFCAYYTNASLQAASALEHQTSDIAINWSGIIPKLSYISKD